MTLAEVQSTESPQWQSFMREPAAYAEPRRLSTCFGGSVGGQTCERLLATERLRGRLSSLLLRHYGLLDRPHVAEQDLAKIDRDIALSSSDRLMEIALHAGAIYWSGSFAGAILGQTAAALHDRLGVELCEFGVANRELAGPVRPIEPLETIRERVAADGWRCLGAWCLTVPDAVGPRVRLKHASIAAIEALDEDLLLPFAEFGPAAVRRAAAEEV